jgi:hypothetical protein
VPDVREHPVANSEPSQEESWHTCPGKEERDWSFP